MDPSVRARLGALSLAVLLRALPAPACNLLPAGHVHLFADPPSGASAGVEMGKCVGVAAPPAEPPDSPPVKLSQAGLTPEWTKVLEELGYHPEPASDRLTREGRPVSEWRFSRLFEAVDASHTRFNSLIWMHLQTQGYRIDEATCRLKHPEKPDLLNVELDSFNDMTRRSLEHSAMETLKSGLRGLPPGAAIPPALLARLSAMESAQVRLPESLRARLFAEPPPTVGGISSVLNADFAASLAFFDGRQPLADVVQAARPPGEPGAYPDPQRVPVSASEQRLGELMARELQGIFEGTGPGRELLDHFRRPDGSVQLPSMLVLKLTQRPDDPNQPGAIYQHESRQVIFNHWTLLQVVLNEAPPDQRADLSRRLADAEGMRRWLEENPQARRRALESVDFLILHEFVHYRQGDVSSLMKEIGRGNAPSVNALSHEHEAHRQECRYFLSRIAQDPSLLGRGYGYDRQEYCGRVLADPHSLDDRVTDLYTRQFAGAQTLPEVRGLQAVRRDEARRALFAWDSTLDQRVRAGLRLIGYGYGDQALDAEVRRYDAIDAAYARSLDPLRAQLAGAPDAALRDGRVYQAMVFLRGMGWEGREDAARATVRAAAAALERREPRSTLNERLSAGQIYLVLAPQLSLERDPGVVRGHAADMREYAGTLRQQAAALSGSAAEEQLRLAQAWEQGARSWEATLPEEPRPAVRQPAPRRRDRR